MIRSLDLISRLRATPSPHQVAKMALKIQRHLEVPHPDHHPGLWQGNQHQTGLRLSIVWKYRLPPAEDEMSNTSTISCKWQAPNVEDMVQDGKVGLTKAIMTGPGQAILFYRWQLLGEGLSLGEAWDAMFTLSGAISWVGKQAQLSAKPVSLGDGWQLIAQAITEGHIKPRGPGSPHSIPPPSTLFSFHNQDSSPWPANFPASAEWWEDAQTWPSPSTSELRLGTTARLWLRPETMGVMGGPTSVTFTLNRSWIWKQQKFTINFLISGINVWGFRRF